jgi:hypothetical protein
MIGDNYTSDDMGAAFEEGKKLLTVEKIEFVTSTNKGTEGIKVHFLFGSNHEYKMNKTFWESKLLNRFLTSFISALKLEPKELDAAAKVGRFREWLERYVPGRSGEFHCEKGEPNGEGKRYLSPWTQAELDLREWQRSQGNSPTAPEPTAGNRFADGSSADDTTPPDFPDDIPF